MKKNYTKKEAEVLIEKYGDKITIVKPKIGTKFNSKNQSELTRQARDRKLQMEDMANEVDYMAELKLNMANACSDHWQGEWRKEKTLRRKFIRNLYYFFGGLLLLVIFYTVLR
jgi:hypothetical protein